MGKNNGVKFRRKFYSLYIDTIAVLVLFLLLVLVVWLTLRPSPFLKAKEAREKFISLSVEDRQQLSNKFTIRYVTLPELKLENNPELIAFGVDADVKTRDDVVYYSEYASEYSFSPPRNSLVSPNLSGMTFVTDEKVNPFFTIKEPRVALNSILNFVTQTNSNFVVNSSNSLQTVSWTIPESIPLSSMPNIAPIMRKYGWLSGSIDIVITIGEEGFVSNVIINSKEVVDASLRHELERKLLVLHLGIQNANKAFPISVSWNLP